MRRAFVGGVSVLDKDTMNSLLEFQDFSVVYEGTIVDSKTGAGATENSVADYNYAIRITATGTTEIGRITLTADKDGTGADIEWKLRDATWASDGSSDGVLIASGLYPKEFVATTAGTINIPLAVSGLTSGANYWLIVTKAGSATDKIDLIGEASQDAAHPVYLRSGTTGAWTLNNAIHFNAYDWSETGDIITGIEGGQTDWLNYYDYGLLGNVGDCESITGWVTSDTLTADSSNKVQGSYSLKCLSTGGNATATYDIIALLDPAKYYFVSGWVKHGFGTLSRIRLVPNGSGAVTKSTGSVTDTTQFINTGVILLPSDWGTGATAVDIQLYTPATTGDYGYYDSIKVWEITASDSVLTDTQLLAKYPNIPTAIEQDVVSINSYIPSINGDESASIREIMTLTGLKKGVVTSA